VSTTSSEDKTNPRRKTPPAPRRRLTILLLIVTVLLVCGWTATIMVIIGRPDVFGYERARDQRPIEAALAATGAALASTLAQVSTNDAAVQTVVRDLQATRAVQFERDQQLQGSETQQSVYADFTRTAVANLNAQQATQSALGAAATLTAINQLATQAALDFQVTQTALAAKFWTPAPTAPPNIVTIDGGFDNRSESLAWSGLPPNAAWALSGDGGLLARVDHAALLTTAPESGGRYSVEALFRPGSANADLNLLFGVSGGGYGVRVYYVDGRVTSVALFAFDAGALADPAGLIVRDSQVITFASGTLAADLIDLRAEIEGAGVRVLVNGQQALIAELPGPPERGAAGVHVPQGTALLRLVVQAMEP
jgi:hypothetical protein